MAMIRQYVSLRYLVRSLRGKKKERGTKLSNFRVSKSGLTGWRLSSRARALALARARSRQAEFAYLPGTGTGMGTGTGTGTEHDQSSLKLQPMSPDFSPGFVARVSPTDETEPD